MSDPREETTEDIEYLADYGFGLTDPDEYSDEELDELSALRDFGY